MIYKVQARFIEGKREEFYKLINSVKLKIQWPDGPYIIGAMKKATIDSSGLVRWTELCYCPSPLWHERKTVYDKFFTDMETEVVDKHEDFEGESFIDSIRP